MIASQKARRRTRKRTREAGGARGGISGRKADYSRQDADGPRSRIERMDVEALMAPRVREMQPYTPIVPFEVLSKRLGMAADQIVKLDANENPYGASPRALEAMARSRLMHIYPDPDQTELREAIASYVGVPTEHILCGAGADEVIDVLARTFVERGDTIIDLPPTFGMYKWESDVLGARHVTVPRRADFSVDVEAVERLVHASAASASRPKL